MHVFVQSRSRPGRGASGAAALDFWQGVPSVEVTKLPAGGIPVPLGETRRFSKNPTVPLPQQPRRLSASDAQSDSSAAGGRYSNETNDSDFTINKPRKSSQGFWTRFRSKQKITCLLFIVTLSFRVSLLFIIAPRLGFESPTTFEFSRRGRLWRLTVPSCCCCSYCCMRICRFGAFSHGSAHEGVVYAHLRLASLPAETRGGRRPCGGFGGSGDAGRVS